MLCLNSLFSLSGKFDNQIPCFPCAVATLHLLTILSMPTGYEFPLASFLSKNGGVGGVCRQKRIYDT